MDISIHATAKAATITEYLNKKLNSISIHATAKTATQYQVPDEAVAENFNPRYREGSEIGRAHV